jgi:hypothetical protein
MLCHELERAVHRYLVEVAGYLSNSTDQSAAALSTDEPPASVNIDGLLTLHFYRGEANTERQLPCVIILSEGGEGDTANGNETATVEVHVLHQADEATENPEPLIRARIISETLINYMRRDDLVEQLQRYATDGFTPQGFVPPQSHRKATTDRTVEHVVITQLYCANTDVLGQTEAQAQALSEALA